MNPTGVRDKVEKWARQQHAKLQATDPGFRRTSIVHHQDGTVLTFRFAFLTIVDDDWLVCFTEHNGFHIWLRDDLRNFFEYEPCSSIREVRITRTRKISNTKLKEMLLTMEESQAVRLLKQQKAKFRVTQRNGVYYAVTRDYRPERFNLRVHNERVIDVSFG